MHGYEKINKENIIHSKENIAEYVAYSKEIISYVK